MRGASRSMRCGRSPTAKWCTPIECAGYSNYGRYIVIEHVWDGSPYYSLYGHLSEIAVGVGQRVSRGERIARMGYTGEGLNQARAHLHLELNLMFNRNFESWHDHNFRDPNHNGIYNGINLAGLDIARFFLEREKRPDLSVPQFLAEEEDILQSDRAGLTPLRFAQILSLDGKKCLGECAVLGSKFCALRSALADRSAQRTGLTTDADLRQKIGDRLRAYLTRDELAGRGDHAHLTENGMRLMRLLTWPE